MKHSADFRAEAREALRGKWSTAVWTGYLAGLLGVGVASERVNLSNLVRNLRAQDVRGFLRSEAWFQMRPAVFTVLGLLLLWTLVCFIIGGVVQLGYSRFNLRLIDRENAETRDLFSQLDRFGQGFLMQLLMDVYHLLWTLLLLIPGIIKAYAYAMTPYILYEHPEMTPNEAITESRRMMDGKKWDYFCLGFSFIGWDLLASAPAFAAYVYFVFHYDTATMGVAELLSAMSWLLPLMAVLCVGYLFLTPYRNAANAAFYRELIRQQENAPENSELPDSAAEADDGENDGVY